jgi:hypothetical protein
MTPDWVAELARPVWQNEADLVLPIHARHRFEGPLLGQLVRPLLATTYARRLRSNMAGNFGCSRKFAARLVGHAMWERDITRVALNAWVVATGMAEDFRLSQVHLGPSLSAPRAGAAGLPELFEQVVGTSFACIDRDAATWMPRTEILEVPATGQPRDPPGAPAVVDLGPMVERFRSGMRDLTPLLRDILSTGTLAGLQAAATADGEIPRIPDSLWVSTVYEFAASVHNGVMSREHLTQALVPLYLGRTASFFEEIASADETAHTQRLAALEREYEERRVYLVERWNAEVRR